MATEELKDMLQYGHLELADKTMDPGYIQHNPDGAAGARWVQGVREPRSRPHATRTSKPEWKNPPVLTLINGPYSRYKRDVGPQGADPADPSKMYVWNHYDVVRTEGGKIKRTLG